jgi:nitrogen fixation protein NifU and related proteins
MNTAVQEIYQQMILEHNKKPRNFKKLLGKTHWAEGFNPLCGDHYHVYLQIRENKIYGISFEGQGCAISKASSSMMTDFLKGKTLSEAKKNFLEFQKLLKGELNPEKEENGLGKLKVFSGIWKYPSRVKCAVLSWYAMNAALEGSTRVSTE